MSHKRWEVMGTKEIHGASEIGSQCTQESLGERGVEVDQGDVGEKGYMYKGDRKRGKAREDKRVMGYRGVKGDRVVKGYRGDNEIKGDRGDKGDRAIKGGRGDRRYRVITSFSRVKTRYSMSLSRDCWAITSSIGSLSYINSLMESVSLQHQISVVLSHCPSDLLHAWL